jgi:hypothetical protein
MGMGAANFLGALEADSRAQMTVTIKEDRQSAKDYLPISAAVDGLYRIASAGRERLYNVASGAATTHDEVAQILAHTRGTKVEFAPHSIRRRFSAIDTTRLRDEFGLLAPETAGALEAFFAL